jgi:hypothetical protein
MISKTLVNRICGNGATGMDTDAGNLAPAASGGGVQASSCLHTTLEDSVRARVLEEVPLLKDYDVINVDKPVEVNVGRHLLGDFKEESDEEKALDAAIQKETIPIVQNVPVVKEKKKKVCVCVWGGGGSSRY